MKNLKNYVSASVGLVLLVTVIGLSVPQVGHSAFVPSDKDVRVINTAAEAVPVAIQGTPTVTVANSTAGPILIRDVDRPTAQPFQAQVELTLDEGFGGQNAFIPVPAGKLLVIEHVTAWGSVSPDQVMDTFAILTHVAPDLVNRFHYLNFEKQSFAGHDTYTVSQLVRIYADAPSVSVRATRLGSTGSVTFRYTISGYLVNK